MISIFGNLYIQTEKDASSLLKNIDRLSEAVIQTSNVNATKFTGSNFGKCVSLTINDYDFNSTYIRMCINAKHVWFL